MASLTDPYLTLKGARKYLANLKELVTSLQRGEHREQVFGSEDSTGQVGYELPNPFDDLSVEVGVITGQLRAVLDQLVHALFELRNGQPPSLEHRLQFPICTKFKDFQSRIKPDLRGLNVADVASIEKVQPYNGGQWLRDLKLLAEEHKHRKLIQVASTGRIQVRAHFAAPIDMTDHSLPPTGVNASQTMQVSTQIAGTIAFRDGSPVVDKLEILQARVTGVLDWFKPQFN